MAQFSNLSYELTKNLSKKDKKENGIYFTSYSIISTTVNFILEYIDDNKLKLNTILEPSCG